MGPSRWGAVFLVTLMCVTPGSLTAPAAAGEPVRLIFDTDLGSDIDDALALGMVHALQVRGQCRLLAVTLTNDHPQVAPLVDAINTFYGHGDVPIGAARNGIGSASPYVEVAQQRDGDHWRYPHTVRSGRDLPDAVSLLRRVLAAQPDGSVVIVQVGLSSNLAALLRTPADQASPLTGQELVKQKVKLLSVMGGAFVPIEGNARYADYNVKSDLPAATRLAPSGPLPSSGAASRSAWPCSIPPRASRTIFATSSTTPWRRPIGCMPKCRSTGPPGT